MKAIFTGSLQEGVRAELIVNDEDADTVVLTKRGFNKIFEAITIHDPAQLDNKFAAEKEGKILIVFNDGVAGRHFVHGPFLLEDVAEKFGNENKGDDAYALLKCDENLVLPKDRHTEILLHDICWWLRGINAPEELDECSVEHIKGLISKGYREGELCVSVVQEGEGDDCEEFRGWWIIKKD